MSQVLTLKGKTYKSKTTIADLPIDMGLLGWVIALVLLGLVMVASSSVAIAENQNNGAFYFAIKHSVYIGFSLTMFSVLLMVPVAFWRVAGPVLLIISIILLLVVILIGQEINGSRRWLRLGPMSLQVSEFVKLFVITYLAGYLVRRHEALMHEVKGFIRPLVVVSVITALLLAQPDFGAAVIIIATCLVMMFLAGARLWQFIVLTVAVAAALALVATTQEYRIKRLQAFLNPWEDPFGTGYQLTQSLIAFGRGDWLGQGLGNSVQKLEYLPEAHTDFVFAIIGEELGFLGVTCVLIAYYMIFMKSMRIGRRALTTESSTNEFSGYLVFGIAFWLTTQGLINIGVNLGVLPTKGITLPFISYGGSSMLVSFMALAILLRADLEQRLELKHAPKKS
ncbi:MAG: putative lipid II flippase FtsW [Pseudomonadota bacterium]